MAAGGSSGGGPLGASDIHVLLVDDERLSRMVVSSLLRQCGYQVTVADGGARALELLRERGSEGFQLVLTDVTMPDVDGVQVLRHVRQEGSLQALPVIMMSANEHLDIVFECISAGAEDYLLKPVTRKDVQNIWQHVWRRSAVGRVPNLAAEGQDGGDVEDQAAAAAAQCRMQLSGVPVVSEQPGRDSSPDRSEGSNREDAQQDEHKEVGLRDGRMPVEVEVEGVVNVAGGALAQASAARLPVGAADVHEEAQEPVDALRIHAEVRAAEEEQEADTAKDRVNVDAVRQRWLVSELIGIGGCTVMEVMQRKLVAKDRPYRVTEHVLRLYIFQQIVKLVAETHGRGEHVKNFCPAGLVISIAGTVSPGPVDARRPGSDLSERDALLEQSLYLRPGMESGVEARSLEDLQADNMFVLGLFYFEFLCIWSYRSQQARYEILARVRNGALPGEIRRRQRSRALFLRSLLSPNCSRLSAADILTSEPIRSEHAQLGRKMLVCQVEAENLANEAMLNFLTVLQKRRRDQKVRAREQLKTLEEYLSVIDHQIGVGTQGTAQRPTKSSAWERPAKRIRAAATPEAAREASDRDEALTKVIAEGGKALQERLADAGWVKQVEESFFAEQRSWAGPGNSTPQHTRMATDEAQAKDVDPRWDRLGGGLDDFAESLCNFVRYKRLRVRASLYRHCELHTATNMVCSMDFDRNQEFFATAGVNRRIKVFDYSNILQQAHSHMHYPVLEVESRSKLSSIKWNPYIKNYLASADYEGIVHLWDMNSSTPVMEFEEHSKRVWSVDFSTLDPMTLASGGDDGCVKLWNLRQERCTTSLNRHGNVCSVQLSPESPHHVAFGCADYKSYVYDVRNGSRPLHLIAGHSKAVSYVKWLGGSKIVTASTDNTMKLWDLNNLPASPDSDGKVFTHQHRVPERTFSGTNVMGLNEIGGLPPGTCAMSCI